MLKYKASFKGRLKNAIGIMYPINDVIYGDNEKDANLNLYKKYDHIHFLKLELDKTLFTNYPQITANEPMNRTNFFLWLKDDRPDRFGFAFHTYLNQRGFSRQLHKITSEQLQCHKYTFERFWWLKLNGYEV